MAHFPQLENILRLPQWFETLLGHFTQQQVRDGRQALLQGRLAAWQVQRMERLGCLADAEFQVFSQWGEDGIIEWLVHHLGDVAPRFVEFGVETYAEANTRFLLLNRNWKGLVLDGSETNIATVRADPIHWRHDLTAVAAFITRDNINGLLAQHGPGSPLGLMSIDIDGNDYWVAERIDLFDAAILVMEYNAVFGDVHPVSVPYREDFDRTKAHPSTLYYGCSLAAARLVAERRGYAFAGTNLEGNNAFFVRKDLFEQRLAAKLDRIESWPSRFREARDAQGNLTFTSGAARAAIIKDLPVVRCETGEEVPLGSLGDLYSPRWHALM